MNLNVGRDCDHPDLPGMPHLGSGISWTWNGRRVMATPHLKEGKISVIDLQDWTVVKVSTPAGPGFFMRSHENTRYVWADAMIGPAKDTMQSSTSDPLKRRPNGLTPRRR